MDNLGSTFHASNFVLAWSFKVCMPHTTCAPLHCVPLAPPPRRWRRRRRVVVVVTASTAPYAKYAALSSTFWGDRNDPMPEDGVANSIIRKLEVTIRVPTYSVVACHCLVLNRIIGLCSLFTANAPSAAPICSRVDIALFSCPLPVFKNRLESCSHKVFFSKYCQSTVLEMLICRLSLRKLSKHA